MTLNQTVKWLAIGLVSSALCACMGGTVAQQLVRSILMHGADKVTTAAIEASERNDKLAAQKMPLKDTPPDEYKLAFINSGFEKVTLQVEPLPEAKVEEEKSIEVMQETPLVQVEVWNLLIGDEKQRILEKARLQGSISVPPQNEWQRWQVATGESVGNQQTITFLIPPEIGKLHSGAIALVELSSTGELSVARYATN
ncbi:MAG TPA: hypothetical protein VK946_05360 [Methylotenera sp.]|nr:hypothetical protein [Methylotenera sp.]